MRSLLARLAVLGALAVSMSACSGGNGNSLPFAGPPNNAGGSPGTIQSGANGVGLLRVIQGSPDSGSGASHTIDVCVDNLPLNFASSSVNYGSASGLYSIPAGIGHTVSVFPSLGGANVGLECQTAPGPYLGTSAIKVTTITPGLPSRTTVVLGGTSASKTLGLYVFSEPIFQVSPAGAEVISHNAAPAFSTGKANGVGFGQCTTTAIPCATPAALTGAQNVSVATVSTTAAAVPKAPVTSAINTIPAGFFDGAGVAAGVPVPITSIAAPSAAAGQPYVIELYAIDAAAGGLGLVAVPEQTLGFGF